MRVSIRIQPLKQDSSSHYRDQRPLSARREVHRSRSRRSKVEERVVKKRSKEREPPSRQCSPIYRSTPTSMDRNTGNMSKYVYFSQAQPHSDYRRLRNEEERILFPSRSLNYINVEVDCTPSISSSSTSSLTSNFDVSNFSTVKGETFNDLYQQPIENERVIRVKPKLPRVVVEMKHPQGRRRRRHSSQPKLHVAEKQYPKPKLRSSSRPRLERKRASSSSSEENIIRVVHEIHERPNFRDIKKRVWKKPVIRNKKRVLQSWNLSK
ncbi:unnamed protein product [Rodentolepis nana]|uniref:Uncharacterized protein n=1 Tax=Rodentolepis nana TaxID=102285 RepID=A0A0R3T228_RODNA|nr:unnamed protein product [Rodentolepis nana]